MRKIADEFAGRAVSRQRKWQLRQRQAGRCVECGAPAAGPFCLRHLVARRELMRGKRRRQRRNYGARSYRLEAEARGQRAEERGHTAECKHLDA